MTILGIAIVVKKFQMKIQCLSLPPGYTYNDKNCHLMGQNIGMIGSEDLALGKYGIVFVSSGDILQGFHHRFATAAPGGMWILDIRPDVIKDPVRVEIEGGPVPELFHPHGIDVSNSTDKLFAVNHNDIRSSVEVYQIIYKPECISISTWICTPITLNFLTSVTSELFPKYGINDVAEIGMDNF